MLSGAATSKRDSRPWSRSRFIGEERRRRIRLDHEMKRQPPPIENGSAVQGSKALDRLPVPQLRVDARRLQATLLRHAVSARELSAFGRKHAKRGRSVNPRLE